MGLVNSGAPINSSNTNNLVSYSYTNDTYCTLNATGYGLVQSQDGSSALNPKTPAYVLVEQLRLLADKALVTSAPIFFKFGQAISTIDRVIARALNIFPGASAEAVTQQSTSVITEECAAVKPGPKFPPLTFTKNNLIDIINFINDKNIVVLHTTNACRVFHSIPFDQAASQISLENYRVIYIDCSSHPGLLAKGEWEWYIKDSIKGVKELGFEDKLREIIIDQELVPNKKYLSLGY